MSAPWACCWARVLREQAGDELYEKVEELRQPAIRRRELQAKGQSAKPKT